MNVAHNRALSIAFAALLLFSLIPVIANQQAQALSAITFTTLETVDSQHEQFQQVYENSTNSVVYVDANSSGTFFKDSYVIATDTLDSDTGTLTNTTYVVDSHAYASPVDLSRYSLQFDGSADFARAGANTVYDVTTQDFWMAGRFQKTAGSGASDDIIMAKNTGGAVGYFARTLASTDQLAVTIRSTITITATVTSHTIQNNEWYVWAYSADRDGLGTAYLYRVSTDTLYSATANIASQNGLSLTNTQTFTVARASPSSANFFPGYMDDLIPPQIGDTLSQAEFEAFAESGTLPDGITNFYDLNEGIAGLAIDDRIGSNNLTPTSSPPYSSTVTPASLSRPTIYVTGRDSDNSTNGYGKWNLGDLSEVDDEYFSSDLAPLDIAQSTSNLYTAAINGTDYGTLYDVSMSRSFGSYTETAIVTGDATTPALGILYEQNAGTLNEDIRSGSFTTVAEEIEAGSVLVGNPLNSVLLSLSKDGSPTGTATIGVWDESGTLLFTCDTLDVSTLTTSQANYIFGCAEGYDSIQAGDRIGIRYTGGGVSDLVEVHYQNSDVIPDAQLQERAGGAWQDITGDIRGQFMSANAEIIVYDGSPDTRYTVFESDDELRVVKRTGSTTLIATAMDHTVGESFSVIQLSDRIIIQTATNTYQLIIANDTISEIFNTSFNTLYSQTYEVSPASRTFNSDAIMIANSTYAIEYVPNGASSNRVGVFIDSITTGSSGTISGFDEAKYYYLPENDLVTDASSESATTWNIRDVGSREALQVTAYTESLGIDLVENTTSILATDVIRLVCDNGNYLIQIQYFAVGSDADCTLWRVLADSSASVGRELFSPYDPTVNAVHADTFTGYTFEINAGDPTVYTLYSSYDSTTVDVAEFDSAGQLQQRYLYGNCYQVLVVNENTGANALIGNVCANDATTKSINIDTITVPTNWQGRTWSWNLNRDYSDPDDNTIIFSVESDETPFDAYIHIENNLYQNGTVDEWYNFTDQTAAVTVNNNGYFSNNTLWITVYSDSTAEQSVVRVVSAGKAFQLEDWTTPFGPIFGISMMGFFVVIVAGLFPRSMGTIAIIAVLATAGILWSIGWLEDLPIELWGGLIGLAAIGIIADRRR